MIAKNMKELNSMLNKELKKAMNVVSEKALANMYEAAGEFYTQGEPKMYERTGALGNTPRTTSLSSTGNSVSFEAYLDKKHQYTTGKNPSMEDVLKLANNGITNSSVGKLRKTVGKQGFWEEAEKKIEKDLDDTLSNFFEKK